MVKTTALTNFIVIRSALLRTIDRKIIASKVINVNELISPKLKVEMNSVIDLLNGIEAKFRKCEIIFIAYFENVDHSILSGNSAPLPFTMECTFIDSTSSLKYFYDCDDKQLYKELIDMNFQNFILMISSIYESLVTLFEIMIKKVVIHTKEKPPISIPLQEYIKFLRILINLGYRENDELNYCFITFDSYFQTYLETINQLRNRFIHGYGSHLRTDGFNYKITTFQQGVFTNGSPLLNIDIFTKQILDNTRNFIQTLYPALEKTVRHYKKSLPA